MTPARTEQLLNWVVASAAVVVALLFVRRELTTTAPPPSGALYSPRRLPDSETVREVSIELADASGAMQLVVFLDLECPACRIFHLNELAKFRQQARRSSYSLRVVHLPLHIHQHAEDAARAAECAGEHGKFEQFIDVVLARQGDIATKSWVAFALDAAITDTTAFVRCLQRQAPFPRVERGKLYASANSIRATPSVMVNGWLLAVPPSAGDLLEWVAALERGDDPFGVEFGRNH